MRKTYFFLSCLLVQKLIAQTQPEGQEDTKQTQKEISFIYDADFEFLFDNLEQSDPFWDTRTLIAAKLSPEIGLSFFGQRLKFGGFFTLKMGEQYPKQWGLTLFYDFQAKDFSGYFGIFSKKYRIGQYPLMFFRQDYEFFHPLINGVMLQYDSKSNYPFNLQAEFIFDWYGGDLSKRIDEFLIQGFLRQSFLEQKIYWGGAFLLYHTKNDELLNLDGHDFDTYLLDRFYYYVFLGSDLSSLVPEIQALSFELGVLSSLERKRRHSSGNDPFSHQVGWQLESKIAYKGFGIDNKLYWGDSQYKYFHQYGEEFYAGLPFYQSPLYNRTEFYYEYQNRYLKARASFVLHATKKRLANQQMISLAVDTAKLFSLLF